jgi:hypothetical protein
VRERVCVCVCRMCGGSVSAGEGREESARACTRTCRPPQAHVPCARCACSYAEEGERLNGTRMHMCMLQEWSNADEIGYQRSRRSHGSVPLPL